MFCLYADCRLCTFTMMFYTCVWIPFLQITQPILRVFTSLCNRYDQPENVRFKEANYHPIRELDLPVVRYQDLELSNGNRGEEAAIIMSNEEEVCSICLMEFEKNDLVNKLPKCGHVFHMECMDKWLDKCHFTCPLCRSSVLRDCSSTSTNLHAWSSVG